MKRVIEVHGAILLFVVVLAILTRLFLFQVFRVPGGVMTPTLRSGDLIFVEKWTSRYSLGDIVLYENQNGALLIKRVVGLEGEKIGLSEGKLVRQGETAPFRSTDYDCGKEQILTQEYGICREAPVVEDLEPVKVPAGRTFLISDNRTRVRNGRVWEVVSTDSIRGRAVMVWLSFEPGENVFGVFPKMNFERFFVAL